MWNFGHFASFGDQFMATFRTFSIPWLPQDLLQIGPVSITHMVHITTIAVLGNRSGMQTVSLIPIDKTIPTV